MAFMIKTIIILFIAVTAIKAGSVWDSHTYPQENAVVGYEGGTVKGSMSRNFDGSVDVFTSDGNMVTIPEHSQMGIGYKIVNDDRVHWRFWLPSLLVMLGYVVFVGKSLLKDMETLFHRK
jgi:hypothetical protein